MSDIIKVAGEFLERLNQAEARTEYANAWDKLQRSAIDFQAQDATNPDYEGAADRWDKAKQGYWQAATAGVKNQDALAALQDSWDGLDVKQYAALRDKQVQQRTGRMISTTDQTINNIVNNNKLSNDDRKRGVRNAMKPLIDLGLVKPEGIQQAYDSYDKQIDANAMGVGLTQIARAEGWDYASDLVDNPDFTKFFPSLNQDDRNAIRTKLETQQRYEQAQAQKIDQLRNSAYDDKMNQAFGNLITGQGGALTIDMINDPNGFSQSPDGERHKTAWLEHLRTFMHEQEVEARQAAREEKTGTREREAISGVDAMDIINDDNYSQPEKALLLRELGAKNRIPPEMVSKWISQSRQRNNNRAFFSLLSKVDALTRKGPNGEDPTLSIVQADELKSDFLKQFDNNPQITVSELQGKLDDFVDKAKQDTVKKAFAELGNDLLSTVPYEGVGPDVHRMERYRGPEGTDLTQQEANNSLRNMAPDSLRNLPQRPKESKALYRAILGGVTYAYVSGFGWTHE